MPIQTTKTANVYFPDGARVEVRPSVGEGYYDVGAINSAVTATLNWTESNVETANAGALATRISKMEIAGGFTLINLNPEGVAKMGGGLFTLKKTPGEPVTPSNQLIPNLQEGVLYPLELHHPSSGANLTTVEAPVMGTVKATEGGTISAGTGYKVVAMENSPSGWGIIILDAGSDAGKELDIAFGSNTPVASTTIHAGSSTIVLKPYALRIVHEDDNLKKRTLELPCVYGNSGGFQFNFKGANEDGVEEMPLTFTAKLDTTKANGQQLMSWTIEDGAA